MARSVSLNPINLFRLRKVIAPVLLLGALGGCAQTLNRLLKEPDPATPFRELPLEEIAWRPTTALAAIQRRVADDRETVFVLENHTSIGGENTLMFIAYNEPQPPVFEYDPLLERLPGSSTPFTSEDYGALLRAEDSMGPFVWLEKSSDETSCVLALRRLQPSQVPLEIGLATVDMVLRNCIEGEVETALAPLAFHNEVPRSERATQTRNLSLLAAPLPPASAFPTGAAQ